MGSNKLYVFSVKSEHHIIYKSKYYVILIASLQERFRKLNGIFSLYGFCRLGLGMWYTGIQYTLYRYFYKHFDLPFLYYYYYRKTNKQSPQFSPQHVWKGILNYCPEYFYYISWLIRFCGFMQTKRQWQDWKLWEMYNGSYPTYKYYFFI